jgi:NADPH:quinone reductase-like Zn-dependent oxidoreductase
MRAIEVHRNGGPEVLEGTERPDPQPCAGQLLVQDGAAGVNFMDICRREGGPVPPVELQRLAAGGSLFVTQPTLGSYVASRGELLRRAGDLFSWIQQCRLSVRIGGTYPLNEAARAHEDLGSRGTTGKLLLLP